MFTLNIQPPTLRLAADRVSPANQLTAAATATQAMSRRSHTAMVAMSDVALVVGNYYSRNWNGGTAPAADTAPGASATVTASVEYPAGTFTQIKFTGSAMGTIPDGDLLKSDTATISIPKNAQFWTRLYYQCSAGIVTTSADFIGGSGDATKVGTSGVSDQTMSGSITSNTALVLQPCAVLATSISPAVAIIGTSIAAGVGDTLDPGNGKHGFANSITTIPCVNLAQGGANIADWISGHTIHQKLLPYCTAMLTDHGTNDYVGATPAATCVSRLQTLYALMPGKQIFQTTILQRVTSSDDGFTTLSGQLAYEHSDEPYRKDLNTAIHAGISGVTALFDTVSVLESSLNSGFWRVSSDGHGNSAPYTLDGTHPTPAGQYVIRDSGIIDQTRFT